MGDSPVPLTMRQRIVHAALLSDPALTNHEIAEGFKISPRTVGTEIAAIRNAGCRVPERVGRPSLQSAENRGKGCSENIADGLARDYIEEVVVENDEEIIIPAVGLEDVIRQVVKEYGAYHGWDASIHDAIVANLAARTRANPEGVRNPVMWLTTGEPCAVAQVGRRFHVGWLRATGREVPEEYSCPPPITSLPDDPVSARAIAAAAEDAWDIYRFSEEGFPASFYEALLAYAARMRIWGDEPPAVIDWVEQVARHGLAAEDVFLKLCSVAQASRAAA